MRKDLPLYPKELSWLSFNERVLQEAEDENVPIIDRVHFLGIFSNNLDEFFRVHVGEVRRLTAFATGTDQKKHFSKLLGQINRRITHLQRRYTTAYLQVLKTLDRHNIHIVPETSLNQQQYAFINDYFHSRVLPELEPFFIDGRNPMPLLSDKKIYFVIDLKLNGEPRRYAVMDVPTSILPRFIEIPARKDKKEKVYIVLDNIIRAFLIDIFRNLLPITSAQAYMFKIGRDAEIKLNEQVSQSVLNRVERSLKQRKRADPVRLVYDSEMPKPLLELLKRKLKMGRYDTYTPGGRYHNSKDFMSFARNSKKYQYKKMTPLPAVPVNESIFSQLQKGGRLFYYPYHDFRATTNFLASAAIDPQVKEIRITLYRIAKNSRVITALINAVRNNKKVIAIVELRARFSEKANIHWAHKLSEAGVQVVYGVPEMEVHAKLISVVRREQGKNKFYTELGTGNFNEMTARIYCDFSYLIGDQNIGRDIYNLFEFMRFPNVRKSYKHIIASPFSFRRVLEASIEREIEAARAGREASLFFKCNGLVDSEVIAQLYRASAAGVKIKLIIRGECSLVCETPGLSDNIQTISLVDKFLEHSRVYIFHNGGEEVIWISSANLKKRCLDERVEVTLPVVDLEHRKLIRKIMDLQWNDNQKARVLDVKQTNTRLANRGGRDCRAQDAIYRYLKELPQQ
ncbi:polyphosphate kinase 1 [Microbulbifer epialgicus]|uniref:Polyphosphate kinase n=1 Tax=Microbulbifer epialgicus TaxID=393907 RepID=A0ABV4P0P9_9GAMM